MEKQFHVPGNTEFTRKIMYYAQYVDSAMPNQEHTYSVLILS
jgi:hypothetical protein